jgi:hypothetical protein
MCEIDKICSICYARISHIACKTCATISCCKFCMSEGLFEHCSICKSQNSLFVMFDCMAFSNITGVSIDVANIPEDFSNINTIDFLIYYSISIKHKMILEIDTVPDNINYMIDDIYLSFQKLFQETFKLIVYEENNFKSAKIDTTNSGIFKKYLGFILKSEIEHHYMVKNIINNPLVNSDYFINFSVHKCLNYYRNYKHFIDNFNVTHNQQIIADITSLFKAKKIAEDKEKNDQNLIATTILQINNYLDYLESNIKLDKTIKKNLIDLFKPTISELSLDAKQNQKYLLNLGDDIKIIQLLIRMLYNEEVMPKSDLVMILIDLQIKFGHSFTINLDCLNIDHITKEIYKFLYKQKSKLIELAPIKKIEELLYVLQDEKHIPEQVKNNLMILYYPNLQLNNIKIQDFDNHVTNYNNIATLLLHIKSLYNDVIESKNKKKVLTFIFTNLQKTLSNIESTKNLDLVFNKEYNDLEYTSTEILEIYIKELLELNIIF